MGFPRQGYWYGLPFSPPAWRPQTKPVTLPKFLLLLFFFSFRIIECGFFLCVLFYTGAQLINNVVLVLGLQQSGSFMHIRVSNILKLFSQLGCYRILKRTPSHQKEWRWLEYNSFSVADKRKNPKVWEHDLVRLTLNKP